MDNNNDAIAENEWISSFDQELSDAIANVKLLCSYKRIPMYAIFAIKNEEDTTVYHRECLYASLGLNNRDERISNLILAAKKCEERMPEHIEKCIQDLSNYIESRQAIQASRESLDVNLNDDQIQHMADIGDGFVTVKPPQEILNGGIRYDEDIDSLPDYEEADGD